MTFPKGLSVQAVFGAEIDARLVRPFDHQRHNAGLTRPPSRFSSANRFRSPGRAAS